METWDKSKGYDYKAHEKWFRHDSQSCQGQIVTSWHYFDRWFQLWLTWIMNKLLVYDSIIIPFTAFGGRETENSSVRTSASRPDGQFIVTSLERKDGDRVDATQTTQIRLDLQHPWVYRVYQGVNTSCCILFSYYRSEWFEDLKVPHWLKSVKQESRRVVTYPKAEFTIGLIWDAQHLLDAG